MGRSFWVSVLIFIFCPGALSALISITARVGSTAVLPCDCRNVTKAQSSSESPHVQWLTSSGTVFERRGEGVYRSEGYEGRVDVPEDQLLKGNCSLVLKDVRAEDEGVYKSYLVVERRNSGLQYKSVLIQTVELLVKEITDTDDNQRRDSSDGRCSNCRDILTGGVIGGVILVVFLGEVTFLLHKKKGKNDPQNPQLQPLAPGGGSGSNFSSKEDIRTDW